MYEVFSNLAEDDMFKSKDNAEGRFPLYTEERLRRAITVWLPVLLPVSDRNK